MRIVLALLAVVATAEAGELRPLSPDRPTVTASPVTVDRSHLQLELDFFRFSRDRDIPGASGQRVRIWNLMPLNLKFGLRDNLDVQLGIEPLVFQRTEVFDPTTSVERDGFGHRWTAGFPWFPAVPSLGPWNTCADDKREDEGKDSKTFDDRGRRHGKTEDFRLFLEGIDRRGDRAALPHRAIKQGESGEETNAEKGARILRRDLAIEREHHDDAVNDYR